MIATEEAIRISKEVYAEGGKAEEALGAKCNWECCSRTAIIMRYGDPRSWDSVKEEGASDVG